MRMVVLFAHTGAVPKLELLSVLDPLSMPTEKTFACDRYIHFPIKNKFAWNDLVISLALNTGQNLIQYRIVNIIYRIRNIIRF